MPLTLRASVVLSAVLLLLSVACGSPRKDTMLPAGPTPEPPPTGLVEGKDSFFQPKEITIKVGKEVTWSFTGALPHDAVADDGSFDTHPGCLAATQTVCSKQGDAKVIKFTKVGEFPYYCAIHGIKGGYANGIGMVGKVTVQA